MERAVPLSSKLGEVMAPQTLVTAIVIGPDGAAKLDAGALHGRSELESRLQLVPTQAQVGHGQSCWITWVAIELDPSDKPLRYKGLSVSEVLVNLQQRLAYKSLADSVNRMSDAMQGKVNVSRLSPDHRRQVGQLLMATSQELWQRSAPALQKVFEV